MHVIYSRPAAGRPIILIGRCATLAAAALLAALPVLIMVEGRDLALRGLPYPEERAWFDG